MNRPASPTLEPWRLLRERTRRDFRIFQARTMDVADPRDGAEYVRTVLEAPDWVNVIPVTTADEVVLIRQFRFGTWSETLEIPGGMVDPGELPPAAAARELEEETGYSPGALRLLEVSHPNPAILTNALHSFVALDCVWRGQPRPDTSEDIRVELVPRRELRQLVASGRITHALVLAALLYDAWRDG